VNLTWNSLNACLHEEISSFIHEFELQGANCLAHADSLKILIAGCEDGIFRIFSYLNLNEVKLIIEGHTCPIVGLQILDNVSDDPMLVSYAEDVVIGHKLVQNYETNCIFKL